MEVVKHYWKVGYEWNGCPLDSYGEIIDVDHGDTLIELFGRKNSETIMQDVKNGKLEIRLQRWKYAVDQWGDETGDQDFDYANLDEDWNLDMVSDYYGKKIPQRFQKELNKYFNIKQPAKAEGKS